MEQAVGFERLDRLGEGEAVVQGEPFSSVAMPLQVEAIATDRKRCLSTVQVDP